MHLFYRLNNLHHNQGLFKGITPFFEKSPKQHGVFEENIHPLIIAHYLGYNLE